jgi:hypothetical protein
MGNETPAVTEQNDVAIEDIVPANSFNHQRIPGPNGGEHAPTQDAQAQASG